MPKATIKSLADVEIEHSKAARMPQPEEAIDDSYTARRAKELLEEALPLKLRHDKDKKRLEEIMDELIVMARGFELPGLRYGSVSLLYNGERSNKFLDKGLLLEHGVSPEVIADSYKPTKTFSDARLILLKTR